jgi:hypothetical protein
VQAQGSIASDSSPIPFTGFFSYTHHFTQTPFTPTYTPSSHPFHTPFFTLSPLPVHTLFPRQVETLDKALLKSSCAEWLSCRLRCEALASGAEAEGVEALAAQNTPAARKELMAKVGNGPAKEALQVRRVGAWLWRRPCLRVCVGVVCILHLCAGGVSV